MKAETFECRAAGESLQTIIILEASIVPYMIQSYLLPQGIYTLGRQIMVRKEHTGIAKK